ncbi:MAG: hypothetical protein PHV75_06735 [Victivallaceae bacterium]|nr:hypothetical protein [Victivallaceae bacterium]MDD3116990.1 hypothetical protein [Victivallaceae bacterium]MDD4318197.1 hypothetical protein [Victivallaceae bacterium]NLK83945.1 hypothetical protein [Lentisphaerota bacterium]
MMKRWNCKELHELSWCPGVLRDGMTDFLSFFAIHSKIYKAAYPKIMAMLDERKESRMIDICAGGGLYSWRMLQQLQSFSGRPELCLTLSDLYPNKNWLKIRELAGSSLKFAEAPVDARDAFARFKGLHLMFAALHHFSPQEIVALIDAAAEHNQALACFDYFQRDMKMEFLLVFCAPILLLCTSFLIYPFSWKRLFFTYIVPLLPLMLMVDTFISRNRSYIVSELEDIIRNTDSVRKMRVESGTLGFWNGLGKLHYITVMPK